MAFGEKVFEGNVCVTNVTPTMTSNTAPSPFNLSSSAAVYSSSYPLWKAFDSSDTTYTSLNRTLPVTFQIDYGEGNQYKINRFILTANINQMIKTYTFEASNDTETWDVLYTMEEQEKVKVSIHNFKNDGFYRYYRFNISEKWATALEIYDIKLYSLDKFLYINKIKTENLSVRKDGFEDLNFLDNGKITITQREGQSNIYVGMPMIAKTLPVYDEDNNLVDNEIYNGISINEGVYYNNLSSEETLLKINYKDNLYYDNHKYYFYYLYTKTANALSIETKDDIEYLIARADNKLDENSENLIQNKTITQKLKDFRDNL